MHRARVHTSKQCVPQGTCGWRLAGHGDKHGMACRPSQPVMLPMAGNRCPGWPAPVHSERCFRCAPSPPRLAVKKISRKAKQKAAKEARKARKKDDDVSRAFKEADAGPDPEEQAHVQARERGYFIYAYQGLEEA